MHAYTESNVSSIELMKPIEEVKVTVEDEGPRGKSKKIMFGNEQLAGIADFASEHSEEERVSSDDLIDRDDLIDHELVSSHEITQ